MASVQFKDVEKRYGGVSVIRDLNLEILDHEFMVLVGPSGSGKSTALRMIAGLEDISSGTITIGGRVVNDVPPKDRDVAMVFQNYALYPHMTVRENLDFGLRLRKTPSAEIASLVGEAAAMLGIAGLLDRKPRQLSGGERQRVALGRAIMRKPSAFLFDEPLSNLDAKLRVQMRAEIKKIQRQLQTTTVYVTHDQIEAMTMGSRIAVMRDGRLQQVGAPMEIYRRPDNLFVASFIGALPMNFVPASVGDSGRTLVASGFSMEVPEALRPATARRDGEQITIGLRPEDLRGAPSGGSDGRSTRISIRVEIGEPLGREVVIHGLCGRDPLVCVLGGADRLPEIGSRMEVALDPRDAHLFDAKTERRIDSGASAS
jgi:multiple sugar transport system ATP-binding protein